MTALRIVLVNHCHPDTPHICAERARAFAHALTARGHAVVLLTESLDRTDPAEPPEALARRLDAHDGASPLVVAVTPRSAPLLGRARVGALGPVNRPVLAWSYLTRGDVFCDWTSAARDYAQVLARHFHPNVVWGTFGNTGVLKITQTLAHASDAAYVFDMKDPWSNFIPDPLQRYVAGRFRGARAWTALSAGHAGEVRQWFDDSATVIHSGIPSDWLDRNRPGPPDGVFRLTLSGSLYRADHLRLFADGVAAWLARRTDSRSVEIVYYGNDGDRAAAALASVQGRATLRVQGRVPVDTLVDALAASHANAFIASRDVLFHHKVFELAAAGRPVIAVPGAAPEERNIMRSLGCSVQGGGDIDTLARLLHMTAETNPPSIARTALAAFTWDAQAERLEAVLKDAAS